MKKTLKALISALLSVILLCSVFILPSYAASTVGQVKGLTVVETDDNEVELRWSKVKSASGYRIYIKKGNGSWKLAATTVRTEYEIEHLRSAHKYSFRVRAYKKTVSGEKEYGAYSSVVVTLTNPKKVNNPVIKSTSKTKATISWDKVTRADGYRIYKYDTGTRKWVKVKDVTKLSTSVTVSEKGGDKFRIKAYRKLDGKYYFGDHSDTVTSGLDLIGYSKAKSIALKDAAVEASTVVNYEIKLEKKGSTYYYEIEFESGRYEYEYEINAVTGNIISKEKERI